MLKMLDSDSVVWLHENYPGLTINRDREEIKGEINLKAAYNIESDKFLNLSNCQANVVDGEILSGEFSLTILNTNERSWSDLPALFVHNKNIPLVMNRHFNERLDKSACLCGPMQEKTFLSKDFEFGRFFEHLIIPFLYGQLYYSKYNKWPWQELGHGGIGALESYFIDNDSMKVIDCLKALKLDTNNWYRIEKSLQYQGSVKGHQPCYCGSGRPIRSCHPDAWHGMTKLKEDMVYRKIAFPKIDMDN